MSTKTVKGIYDNLDFSYLNDGGRGLGRKRGVISDANWLSMNHERG